MTFWNICNCCLDEIISDLNQQSTVNVELEVPTIEPHTLHHLKTDNSQTEPPIPFNSLAEDKKQRLTDWLTPLDAEIISSRCFSRLYGTHAWLSPASLTKYVVDVLSYFLHGSQCKNIIPKLITIRTSKVINSENKEVVYLKSPLVHPAKSWNYPKRVISCLLSYTWISKKPV